MADLNAFIAELSGKKLDYDGNSGAQCVDLAKRWAAANSKPVIRGNAIVWRRAPGYTWVDNRPGNKPNPGDLVVFNIGPYGHIAIATDQCTLMDCVTFDQNYPVGSPCKIVNHRRYAGVLGWLRVLPDATAKWATVNKAAANVRTQPNTQGAVTSVLRRGDKFKWTELVDGEDGKWIKSAKGHYVWAQGIIY